MRAAIRKSLCSYLRKITANASPSPKAVNATNSFSDSWLPGTCIGSGEATILDLKFFISTPRPAVIDTPTWFLRRAVNSVASISEKSRSALGESFHFSLFRHEVSKFQMIGSHDGKGAGRLYADGVSQPGLDVLTPLEFTTQIRR